MMRGEFILSSAFS